MSDKWIIDRLENSVGDQMARNFKNEMISNSDNVGSVLVHISPNGEMDITQLVNGVKK